LQFAVSSLQLPPAVVIDIRVIPRARRTSLDGMRAGSYLIRLAAPPVEGAANDALIGFLAQTLGLPRRNVTLVAGDKSRNKRVQIVGLEMTAINGRLLR
jgi:uncharacterized protein